MPMPPSQCSAQRHRLMACGNWSSPVMTVAPVVDRPDMLSKKPSVNDSRGAASIIGIAAAMVTEIHDRLTSR